jgi:integrase
MVVHLAVQSGCRWGEVSELRGRDIRQNPDAPDTDYLDVQRAAADVGINGRISLDGFPISRFVVEDSTKGGTDRRIGLSPAMSNLLRAYITEHAIGDDDLLFPLSRLKAEVQAASQTAEPDPLVVPVPDDLGRTEPNAAGRTYRHGTMSGYNLGKCKCQWCRRAYAVRRAERRAQGLPDRELQPKPSTKRAANLTDHCPDDWFRKNVWLPALEKAGLSRRLTFIDLRHTHATWLARSGKISVQELKERMGHKSLVTTQRYIDDADVIETVAAAVIDDILTGAKPPRRQLRAL